MELERLENDKLSNISAFDFSKYESKNELGLEKMNRLKQMIQLKRKRENNSDVVKEDNVGDAKIQKTDNCIDDKSQVIPDTANQPKSENNTVTENLLGLNYDSYSDDD